MEEEKTITREGLKEKIDRRDEFVLVETLPEQAFRWQYLPGAALEDLEQIPALLSDKGIRGAGAREHKQPAGG